MSSSLGELSAPSPSSLKKEANQVNIGKIERIGSAVAGGTLAALGLSRRSTGGLMLSLLGASLLYRGVSGHCECYRALGINTKGSRTKDDEKARDVHIEKSIMIDRAPEELYRFWRQLENLPRFMKHLESVTTLSDERSHWVANTVAGKKVEWDAEIYNEKENELIAWRSLPGSDVTNAGSVRFKAAPGHRGTIVQVTLNYNAPGGKVGAFLAKVVGQEPRQLIDEDLRRLKQIMEAGEVATVHGQTSARGEEARPFVTRKEHKKASMTPASELGSERASSQVA